MSGAIHTDSSLSVLSVFCFHLFLLFGFASLSDARCSALLIGVNMLLVDVAVLVAVTYCCALLMGRRRPRPPLTSAE